MMRVYATDGVLAGEADDLLIEPPALRCCSTHTLCRVAKILGACPPAAGRQTQPSVRFAALDESQRCSWCR